MDPHLINFFYTRNLLFRHPHFLSDGSLSFSGKADTMSVEIDGSLSFSGKSATMSVNIDGSLSFSGKSATMSVNIDGSLSLAEIFQVSTFMDPHLINLF